MNTNTNTGTNTSETREIGAPTCAEGCGGSVDGEGRAHVDCDAPEQGTAGERDGYAPSGLAD
jgi:hypothetical protein